jgi:hypothetical protein
LFFVQLELSGPASFLGIVIELMGVTIPAAVCCHALATESPTDRVLTRECSFQVLGNIGSVLLAGYPIGVNFLFRGHCLSIGEFASFNRAKVGAWEAGHR